VKLFEVSCEMIVMFSIGAEGVPESWHRTQRPEASEPAPLPLLFSHTGTH